jgi:hypothetical protein
MEWTLPDNRTRPTTVSKDAPPTQPLHPGVEIIYARSGRLRADAHFEVRAEDPAQSLRRAGVEHCNADLAARTAAALAGSEKATEAAAILASAHKEFDAANRAVEAADQKVSELTAQRANILEGRNIAGASAELSRLLPLLTAAEETCKAARETQSAIADAVATATKDMAAVREQVDAAAEAENCQHIAAERKAALDLLAEQAGPLVENVLRLNFALDRAWQRRNELSRAVLADVPRHVATQPEVPSRGPGVYDVPRPLGAGPGVYDAPSRWPA